MGLLNLTLPTVGQPNSTEDVDVVNAFNAIQTLLNGNLDNTNFTSGGLRADWMATGANGLAKGAFSAFRNAAVGLGAAPPALVVMDTEEFDVSSWYDTTTGRYTPQLPGYYWLRWMLQPSSAVTVWWRSALYKNGSVFKNGETVIGASTVQTAGGTALVQANGTTDFFQPAAFWDNGGAAVTLAGGASGVYFQGSFLGRS